MLAIFPRCAGLYTITPSTNVKVWSGDPPRTYRPLEISEGLLTPGNSSSDLKRSTSPLIVGSFLSNSGEISIVLVVALPVRFPSTITSPSSISSC